MLPMQEQFKIYIDRLNGGQEEEISECFSSDFMTVSDGGLVFSNDIIVNGRVYLADSHLVLHLDIATKYKTFCKICNEDILAPLDLKGLYLTEEVENIPGRIFDMEQALRDAILLEIPMYSECEDRCPRRAELDAYLAKGKAPNNPFTSTTLEE